MLPENEEEVQRLADQKARTILREGFIKAINDLAGKPCHVYTYERHNLKTTFTAWKPDGTDILVTNLETPIPAYKYPSALLRSIDLLAINFDDPVQ